MKKNFLIALLTVVFLAVLPLQAKTLARGTTLSDIYIGGGFGMEKSGMDFNNKNFAWGHAGFEVGFSGFYFVNEFLGIGADFHYASFAGSDKEIWDRSAVPYSKESFKLNMDTYNVMAAARVYLTPNTTTRLYVPLGGGAVVGHSRFKYGESLTETEISASATSVDVGGFGGLGLEYNLYDGTAAVSLEIRYNIYRYDIGRLADRIQADNRPGKQVYDYISVLATFTF